MNDYMKPWEHSFRLIRWFLLVAALTVAAAILSALTGIQMFDRLFYLSGATSLVLLVGISKTRRHARDLYNQHRQYQNVA